MFSSSYFVALSSIDLHPIDLSRDVEPIQIIAHPCCPSRLRYRSDFNTNRNRRGVLRSQNNPNYQCPTIRVCLQIFFYGIIIFRTVRFLKNTSIFPNIITSVSPWWQLSINKPIADIFIRMKLKMQLWVNTMIQWIMPSGSLSKKMIKMEWKGN